MGPELGPERWSPRQPCLRLVLQPGARQQLRESVRVLPVVRHFSAKKLLRNAASRSSVLDANWGLLQAVIHPLVHHAPRLADVVNMVMLAAAAGGSGLLATAKYVYESELRRAQKNVTPAPVSHPLAPTANELLRSGHLCVPSSCASRPLTLWPFMVAPTPLLLQPQMLHGVNVAGSKFLSRPRVVAAADFAASAHVGQKRRTGEPYITHCVHTAAIVERMLAQGRTQEADERQATQALSWSCSARKLGIRHLQCLLPASLPMRLPT